MKSWLFLMPVFLLLNSCHKSGASGGSADIADNGKAEKLPPAPANVAAHADNYVRQNVDGQVDASLTAQLRAFVQKQGRLPQSFTEFANRGLDSIPRPPEGTRWVIDAVNQQVKAAKIK